MNASRWPGGIAGVFLIAFGLIAGQASPAETPQYWQLTLSYSGDSLLLLEAGKIPAMRKQVRTPGLRGAALKLGYALTWLDAKGSEILSTQAEMPLGVRVFMDGLNPCRTIIPEAGVFVIRVVGPADEMQPKAIRLTKTGVAGRLAKDAASVAPRAFQTAEITIPITKILSGAAPPPGPISATKIRDTGRDTNRLVIALLGDGYTSANLAAGDFTSHATNFLGAFGGKSPWDIYFAGTNVYRVDIESREQGADEPPSGILVDTYLNASFWTGGIERLLALDGTGTQRAIAAANSLVGVGVWEHIFVLVNSTKYGGSGGGIAVSSVHPSASEVILHEFGHSFADLADEYEYGGTAPPSNDSEPNVDFHYTRGPELKWLIWVEPTTPLPTPEESQYGNVVGAFEGAVYYPTGIYRPWLNCLMRALGVNFCPVCKEAHVLEYTHLVDLADSITPPVSTVQRVGSGGRRFAISPVPITPLTYEWRVGGNPIAGATSSSLTVTQADLPTETNTLQVRIAHPTALVRRATIAETYSWTVVAEPTGVGSGVWSLYK